MRAGSVAVAGHALDCAECAGMRRMCWNAPTALECAGKHRLRRIAPMRLLCRLRWNCTGLALEFCLQPGTQPILPCGCRSLVATSVLQPAVSGQCLSCQLFVAHCWQQFPQSCDFSSIFSQRDKPIPVKNSMCCCCKSELFEVLKSEGGAVD